MGFTEKLTTQQKSAALVAAGFFLWFVPLKQRVDPFMQLLCFGVSASCFGVVLAASEEISYESKIIRQHRLQRLEVQTSRMAFETMAKEMDLQRVVLLPVQKALAAAVTAAEPQPENENPPVIQQLEFIHQKMGDIAIDFIDYVWSKGGNHADENGWIPFDKLRVNWGRNNSMNADQLRDFLAQLVALDAGEWADSTKQKWRCVLAPPC